MTRAYDFCTGLPLKETDPNSLVTNFSFDDALSRLKSISRTEVAGTTIAETTTFSYSDSPQTSGS